MTDIIINMDKIQLEKKRKRIKKQQKYYENLEKCSICLSKVGKKAKKKTKCGHIFHHYCLDTWLESKIGRASV